MTSRDNELPHPIPQMATFELKNLRETLERRLAQTALPPGTRSRKVLQTQLREVIAEQDERDRIRNDRHPCVTTTPAT